MTDMAEAAPPDDLMTLRETARLLRMTEGALYVRRARAKEAGDPSLAPPALRLGTKVLYSRAAVLRWLAEQQ